MDLQPWIETLQANGYRLTRSRLAVLETIANALASLNPLQVYDKTRATCPGLGLVTVYRTLEKLEELGLIQRVHQPGGCNAYLPSAYGHQHLLICRACGKAEYFEGDQLDDLIRSLTVESGYAIEDHWLQLFGLCAACQSAK